METCTIQTVLRAVMGCWGVPAQVVLSEMNESLAPLWNAPCYLWWGQHCTFLNLLIIYCNSSRAAANLLSPVCSRLREGLQRQAFPPKNNFYDWQTMCRTKEQLWPDPTCPADSTVTSAAPGFLQGTDPGHCQQVHAQHFVFVRSSLLCPKRVFFLSFLQGRKDLGHLASLFSEF